MDEPDPFPIVVCAGHRLLCVGPVDDESHPLYQFKVHALECGEDSYLLAAQALAAACEAVARGESGSLAAAARAFGLSGGDASLGPWWEVAAEEDDEDEDEEQREATRAEFRALLRAQVEESWGHLAQGLLERLAARPEGVPAAAASGAALELLSPQRAEGLALFGRLVSLCALRGVAVSAPSPAAMFAEALMLRRLAGVRAGAVPALARWAELIEEHEEAREAAEEESSESGSSCAGEEEEGSEGGEGEGAPDDEEFDLGGVFRARVGEAEAAAGDLAARMAAVAPGFEARAQRKLRRAFPHRGQRFCG